MLTLKELLNKINAVPNWKYGPIPSPPPLKIVIEGDSASYVVEDANIQGNDFVILAKKE